MLVHLEDNFRSDNTLGGLVGDAPSWSPDEMSMSLLSTK